jgi:hypothetical protein
MSTWTPKSVVPTTFFAKALLSVQDQGDSAFYELSSMARRDFTEFAGDTRSVIKLYQKTTRAARSSF